MAFRHRVDFYYWKGVPVARSWPRKSTQPRTPGEIVTSQAFAAAAIITGAIGSPVRASFLEIQVGHGVTWVDHFRATVRGKGWIHA